MQVMILDSTGAMGVIEGPQLDALACSPPCHFAFELIFASSDMSGPLCSHTSAW